MGGSFGGNVKLLCLRDTRGHDLNRLFPGKRRAPGLRTWEGAGALRGGGVGWPEGALNVTARGG